ncbi:ABC transporter ATP-binding protein [Nakamurella antarctica]|uniref:ABC transporter ATP-binding protein n=1 Tax=Nakamurella antarctica TaxID=1902245 RepID=A0A3G8ZQV6_9ACTN|nr:ABC transporter ATP-binding protein [Nakamurella antarctica]AZI59187.1 ABC transporter ATP-binding protein [Nakamurella antarctica]
MTLLLQATGLVKTFGATASSTGSQALRGAHLTVHEGEIVAVMGPSGSGKSTLLQCAAGVISPDSGTVTFLDAELTAMRERERSILRRSQFGFVFQFGQLIPELTCLENVALPLRLGGSPRRTAEAIAAQWLDRLDVGDTAAKRPGEVSGGQAQRVAIARAMVVDPKILFADEPTGALDSLQGERVMRLLTGTAREAGTAIVLITHEPSIAAYSDREIVVRDGRICETELAR